MTLTFKRALLIPLAPLPGLVPMVMGRYRLGLVLLVSWAIFLLVVRQSGWLLERESAWGVMVGGAVLLVANAFGSLAALWFTPSICKDGGGRSGFWLAGAAILNVILLWGLIAARPWLLGIELYQLQGASMWPVLQPGDLLVVDARSDQRFTEGDIVIIVTPTIGYPLVKRVAPLPAAYQGEADRYWLLGDNAGNSTDSRSYGSFERGDIQGRLAWVW